LRNKENFNLKEIPLEDIRGVLIDIDNTLYPYQDAHDDAINSTYNLFIKEKIKDISRSDFRKIYREKRNIVTERLKPQGACRSRLFAFLDLLEELSIPNSYLKALEYESHYWDIFISKMDLSPVILDFLKRCKKLKIVTCAVSDMQAHIQIRKLERLGVLDLIDFLVTSEEVGCEKPDSKVFDLALRKINLGKEDVIMIGDSLTKDVEAAQIYGIKGYKFEA